MLVLDLCSKTKRVKKVSTIVGTFFGLPIRVGAMATILTCVAPVIETGYLPGA